MLFKRSKSRRKRDAVSVASIQELIPEASEEAANAIISVLPYTMTSIERLWTVWQALHHVQRAAIPGDFVECGVWRGGNLALAGLVCERLGLDRTIYGFDTYAGMSEPTERDFSHHSGKPAGPKFSKLQRDGFNEWCYAPIERVKDAIARTTKYDRYRFIVGKCEDTLQQPENLPDRISILRLDTDWYESTMAELEILYPRLSSGGILIVDDYGHWAGAQQAVDEYFAKDPVFLARIDFTCRLMIKP